jgi:hypothetical protein
MAHALTYTRVFWFNLIAINVTILYIFSWQ